MKTLFTIFLLLFSVSLLAAGNDNDGMGPDNPVTGVPVTTGSAGSNSTVGVSTGTEATINEATTLPIIELSTDGYKATFKEIPLTQKTEKTLTKAAIKKDAVELSDKMETIIKTCKVKTYATTQDYNAKNTCFFKMAKEMNEGKHKFILSTIIALCAASNDTASDDPKYSAQTKYLCYRNVLRAVLKTKKGFVIGWGNKEKSAPYPATAIESEKINSDIDEDPASRPTAY
jgi:hypothetical protein